MARVRRYRGVQTIARLLVVSLLFALPLRAEHSLENARRAQARLDPASWSEIIRIENTAGHSRYPRVLHALVFEFAGVLWFYTDTDGTQSFSLHQDALAEEKADFAPLLHDIEPGFVRWSVVPLDGAPLRRDEALLPNSCFIDSLAAWQQRRMLGLPGRAPRLLSYYADIGPKRWGHTVLTYEREGKLEVVDPTRRKEHRTFPASFGRDALSLARTLAGDRVIRARYIEVPETAAPINVAARSQPSKAGDTM